MGDSLEKVSHKQEDRSNKVENEEGEHRARGAAAVRVSLLLLHRFVVV
jgi:hypothetical protein